MDQEIYDLIRRIPRGRIVSYGEVGRALAHPVSGLLVGRALNRTPPDIGIPWWRVVATGGRIVTGKRDPRIAHDQIERLTAEGISVEGDQIVAPDRFWFEI